MKMETSRAIYLGTEAAGRQLYMLRPDVGHSVSWKFDLYETPNFGLFLVEIFLSTRQRESRNL